MREQIQAYVNGLFADAALTIRNAEVQQEILQHALDRYDDLIASGKPEQEAYDEAVAGIGALHTVDLHGEAVILLMEDDPQRLVAGAPYLHIVHDTQTDGRQDGVLVGDLLRGGGIQIILAAAGAVPVLDVAVSGGSGVDLGHAAQAVVVIGCQITEALAAGTGAGGLVDAVGVPDDLDAGQCALGSGLRVLELGIIRSVHIGGAAGAVGIAAQQGGGIALVGDLIISTAP